MPPRREEGRACQRLFARAILLPISASDLVVVSAPAAWQWLLLGAVQGMTEFLPVSSSGHLVLAERLLRLPRPGLSFEVGLHAGTLVAVTIMYRRDVAAMGGALWRMFAGPRARGRVGARGWDRAVATASGAAGTAGPVARCAKRLVERGGDRKAGAGTSSYSEVGPDLLLKLLIATMPAALAGMLLQRMIAGLFASLTAVAVAWCICGVMLVAAGGLGSRRRAISALRVRDLLWIGGLQALALAPGFSRSGATLAAGLWRGLSARDAARFAFLLSLPTVGGAVLLELSTWSQGGPLVWAMVLPAVVAGASGCLAIRWCVARTTRVGTAGFGYYCLALGGLCLVRAAVTGVWT